MVGVMRTAVGPDFHIMLTTAVRPGWVWDYPTALKVCRGWKTRLLAEEPFDATILWTRATGRRGRPDHRWRTG
jgi:hypothetical protein